MSLPDAISRLASYSLSLQVSSADLRFKVCGFWCRTRGKNSRAAVPTFFSSQILPVGPASTHGKGCPSAAWRLALNKPLRSERNRIKKSAWHPATRVL